MAKERDARSRGVRRGLALALAAAACAPLGAQAAEPRDTVLLRSGKELKGRVLRDTDAGVVLRTGTRDRTIPRAEVQSVRSVAEHHRRLLLAFRDVSTEDPDALLALARFATEQDLPHEARLLRWYAVLRRPGDAALHTALGNRSQGGKFLVSIDGQWVPFDKADALGVDFDDAWRLRSEHFAIRCAAGLKVGLDALFELEALYHAFHAIFGTALELPELLEPIDVRLYRSREQMPPLSSRVAAWFDPDAPALFTCLEGARPCALVHEGTHALAHWFFVRAGNSRGGLPGWLHEGWAEYMDGRMQTRVPGKPVLLEQSVQPGHFASLQAAPKELYGVHRLLNFEPADFQASTRQDLKYAQAWALFRHLQEHGDAGVRQTFADYLRDAARGQGQASTFRRRFAAHAERLETEPWRP